MNFIERHNSHIIPDKTKAFMETINNLSTANNIDNIIINISTGNKQYCYTQLVILCTAHNIYIYTCIYTNNSQ